MTDQLPFDEGGRHEAEAGAGAGQSGGGEGSNFGEVRGEGGAEPAPYPPQGPGQDRGYQPGGRGHRPDRYRDRDRDDRRRNDGGFPPRDFPPRDGGQRDFGNRQPLPPVEMMTESGLLELMQDGFGFLRFARNNYLPDVEDIYVPAGLVRRYRIRSGSMVVGEVQPARKPGQKPSLASVKTINEKDPELHASEETFKNLLPCDPDTRFVLETPPDGNISMRVTDILCPIGRGQRALIVAPPRSGKTILMQQICNSISSNYPDVSLLVLLIDERPEEVTEFKRNTKAEVIASCLDESAANHVRIAEIVLEKMRRQVEAGRHMVVLLDSITRLGRAYNNEAKGGGRIMSGGLDAKVLAKPKAFFGSARNIENGGSLTIIATALIDTGSRMDQVIFEEFKGTGNSEVVLSRQLSNARIYPAIDIQTSGTRKEEKLFHPEETERIKMLRRVLLQLNPNEAMRLLIEKLEKTRSNAEFLLQFTIRDDT